MEALKPTDPEGRRLYLHAIDEAMQRRIDRTPGRRKRRISDITARQMRLVEKLQRNVKRMISRPRREKCEACKRPHDLTAAELPDVTRAAESVTDQIAKLTRALREIADAEKKAMGKLTQDEMREVWKTQVIRVGKDMDLEDKRTLIAMWFGEDVADVLLKGPPTQVAA